MMDSEEVKKRKEYAERKVKERHALLRKEMEEKRKMTIEHRERVQFQLRREQELLQKRIQQLNEDEERKRATLTKQHEMTSRTANINNNKSPKSFAFGSSTPRTLTYLDNLPRSEQQYDKKLKPLSGGSPGKTSPLHSTQRSARSILHPQRAPPAAHRPAPSMATAGMTSSLYVTSSAPPASGGGRNTIKPAATMTPVKNTTLSTRRAAPLPQSMTQSVYTPSSSLSSSPFSSNRRVLAARARATPTKEGAPPSQNTTAKRPAETRKPPMPRKQLAEKKKTIQEKEQNSTEVKKIENKEKETIMVSNENDEIKNQPEADNSILEKEAPEAPKEIEEESIIVVEKIETPEEEVESHSTEIPEKLSLIEFEKKKEEEKEEEEENADKTILNHDESTFTLNSEFEQRVVEPAREVLDDSIMTPSLSLKNEVILSDERKVIEKEEAEQEREDERVLTPASLAEELVVIENDEKKEDQKPVEVEELVYPQENLENDVSDLVDVLGNDFLIENQQRNAVNFINEEEEEEEEEEKAEAEAEEIKNDEEEADSGKASPTSSETSSTTEEITPRSVVVLPKVLPLVKSTQDIERKKKEAEERRARLAEILAKSRGMPLPAAAPLPGAIIQNVDSPIASAAKITPNSPPPSPAEASEAKAAVESQSPTKPKETVPIETNVKEEGNESRNTSSSSLPPPPPPPPTLSSSSNESNGGSSNDVLARLAASANLPSLQKLLQRKQGSNPSLQTTETTGGQIYP